MKHVEIYFMIQNYALFILLGIFILVMFGLGVAYLFLEIKAKIKRKKRAKQHGVEVQDE